MNRSFTLKALTAALILASTTGMVFAKGYKGDYKGEACPPPQMLMTGWYLGAQVGYDSYRTRYNITEVGVLSSNPVMASNGWVGGLMLGYGMMMNNWFYLGGEIFANWANSSNSVTVTVPAVATGTYTFDVDNSYGVGLLPGIKMTDSTLTYIRLGWNWANFQSKATVTTLP